MKPEPSSTPPGIEPAVPQRNAAAQPCCRRCRLPVPRDEREVYFMRSGLCFWCAHVDAQG